MSRTKVFATESGRCYAFDGNTGRILSLGSRAGEYSEEMLTAALDRRLSGDGCAGKQTVDWEYGFEGYLERIEHYVPALLLQVTCRCNLDCDYCVYSGNYAHMESHADRDMSWETMVRSIDFFAEHNDGCGDATVDFYGGEALLCFEQLKAAVEYARERMCGRPLRFGITSNGMLLTPSVRKWLAGNPDVHLTVTVNGPFHDLHRRTVDGKGSLDVIVGNLLKMREEWPEVWEKQVHFLANVTGPDELEALGEFYRSVLGKAPDFITAIRAQDGNETIGAMLAGKKNGTAADGIRAKYCETGDAFLNAYYGIGMRAAHRRRIDLCGGCRRIGSCMPFLGKLFVHWDGRFGICETACERVFVGNLENGFDTERLRRLYTEARELYARTCGGCWAQRLCTVCFKDILNPDGSTMDRIPESYCEASREYTLDRLKAYCEIAHSHPERLTVFETI